MANVIEITAWQAERLYDLLILKKDNPNIQVAGLDRQISRAKTGMTKEDIASVEKLVYEGD